MTHIIPTIRAGHYIPEHIPWKIEAFMFEIRERDVYMRNLSHYFQ